MHFHELLYRASHNRLLTQILTSYQYYTKQFQISSEVKYEHMKNCWRSIMKFFRRWRQRTLRAESPYQETS